MILQRDQLLRIPVVSAGAKHVRLLLNGAVVGEQNVDTGEAFLELPPQPASTDCELVVEWEDGEKEFRDVSFGEVWIAGGQSNMEFPLDYDQTFTSVVQMNDPLIHYYEEGKYAFEGEREEGLKVDAPYWNRWLPFSSEYTPRFSAVAAYFALELRKNLPGVPIGIVSCCWGGTSAACWLAEEDLESDQDLKRLYLDPYRENLKRLDVESYIQRDRQERERAQTEGARKGTANVMRGSPEFFMKLISKLYANAQPIQPGPRAAERPAGLYSTMLLPIAGYPCAGVIWYQGESDDSRAEVYDKLFAAMICRWRKLWNRNIPFLFVQVASFQKKSGLRLPHEITRLFEPSRVRWRIWCPDAI